MWRSLRLGLVQGSLRRFADESAEKAGECAAIRRWLVGRTSTLSEL
eukprot:CAMPEP_0114563778 /NCGR_PEP_ID=MMETSP0114-20121206/13315_1 /TAXON_ID=31324 /ORGANISM="Goniomonas sp, Strain m" /LENGTH=45 /DNA_ID= /DNA_START= /DNA_END= /DNA_ORIENTATION=